MRVRLRADAFVPSFVPDEMYGREREGEQIEKFVMDIKKGKEQKGGVLYISGTPGIGKTAQVLRILNKHTSKIERKHIKLDLKIGKDAG